MLTAEYFFVYRYRYYIVYVRKWNQQEMLEWIWWLVTHNDITLYAFQISLITIGLKASWTAHCVTLFWAESESWNFFRYWLEYIWVYAFLGWRYWMSSMQPMKAAVSDACIIDRRWHTVLYIVVSICITINKQSSSVCACFHVTSQRVQHLRWLQVITSSLT